MEKGVLSGPTATTIYTLNASSTNHEPGSTVVHIYIGFVNCSRLLPLLFSVRRRGVIRQGKGEYKHNTRVDSSDSAKLSMCAVLAHLFFCGDFHVGFYPRRKFGGVFIACDRWYDANVQLDDYTSAAIVCFFATKEHAQKTYTHPSPPPKFPQKTINLTRKHTHKHTRRGSADLHGPLLEDSRGVHSLKAD